MERQEYDVAVIGGGISGLASAARLQASGLETIVLEAHGQVGGCAGFFRRKGFSFDVGATTLVDFEKGGVGGELLQRMDLTPDLEKLPGYKAWLPDREVVLHSNKLRWEKERLEKFGDAENYRRFWKFMDNLAETFWELSRSGVKLPISSLKDLKQAVMGLGVVNLHLARYINWTLADAMKKFDVYHDNALRGLLGMLVEDTVHSTVERAPLINASLGITIRGAGLSRAKGGMYGFWREFTRRYRELGGKLKRGHRVKEVRRRGERYSIITNKGEFGSERVISAVPIQVTSSFAPDDVSANYQEFITRDSEDLGGAIVLFLGVPESEVAGQDMTHHQLMHDYNQSMGDGNNMFISVSSKGDLLSAPEGYRSVMISTHCELDDWERLSEEEYKMKKEGMRERLLNLAHQVYPDLGSNAVVDELATPLTYKRFTSRPRGAVGGVRQKLSNSNQNAVPHWVDDSGFYQVGDTTWPGLGTVAGVLGSKIVAERIMEVKRKQEAASLLPTIRKMVNHISAVT